MLDTSAPLEQVSDPFTITKISGASATNTRAHQVNTVRTVCLLLVQKVHTIRCMALIQAVIVLILPLDSTQTLMAWMTLSHNSVAKVIGALKVLATTRQRFAPRVLSEEACRLLKRVIVVPVLPATIVQSRVWSL